MTRRWSLDAASYRWAHAELVRGGRLLAVVRPLDRQRGIAFENRRSLLAMHEASCNPNALYTEVAEWRPADAVVLGCDYAIDWRDCSVVVSLGLRAYRAGSYLDAVEGLLTNGVQA